MRQVVLDTETTGLDHEQGHRIIEIGCVELVNRRLTGRHYHQYINPRRAVDEGALEVHGISDEFLADKPTFERVVDDFMAFVHGAELVIHNAPFDIGFINSELRHVRAETRDLKQVCGVIDTLVMARDLHPGRRNTLDALCDRYDVDNSQRDLHGALLDAEILADVYIAMTSGQTDLQLGGSSAPGEASGVDAAQIRRLPDNRAPLRVIPATTEELLAHERWVAGARDSHGDWVWQEESAS